MKKILCVVFAGLIVFGVSSGAKASLMGDSFFMSVHRTCGIVCPIFGESGGAVISGGIVGGGVGSVIGGAIGGVVKGFSSLAGKVFSGSGPRCPLLPFIRR